MEKCCNIKCRDYLWCAIKKQSSCHCYIAGKECNNQSCEFYTTDINKQIIHNNCSKFINTERCENKRNLDIINKRYET